MWMSLNCNLRGCVVLLNVIWKEQRFEVVWALILSELGERCKLCRVVVE